MGGQQEREGQERSGHRGSLPPRGPDLSYAVGMWLILLISCVTTTPDHAPTGPPAETPDNIKAPGNLPVMTEAELEVAIEAHESCIEQCIKDHQMRAVSPQEIRVDCERTCDDTHFVGQVEVTPDVLSIPAETPTNL